MASADGKSNPFNTDGKSGAVGNDDTGVSDKRGGMVGQLGINRPQKSGPPDFNPDSVADGGRILKMDPPSDRGGLVGTTASGQKHKPFKLGGSTTTPSTNTPDEQPVGDVPQDPYDSEPKSDTSE
jgi:hypothetical protein